MSAPPDRPLSAEETREALEALPKGLLLLDRNDTVRFSNPASERALARDHPHLVGFPVEELVDFADRATVNEAVRALATGGETDRRLHVRMLSGHMIPVPFVMTIFRLSPGAATGLGILIEDPGAPSTGRPGAEVPPTRAYSLPELLMSDRLKELV